MARTEGRPVCLVGDADSCDYWQHSINRRSSIRKSSSTPPCVFRGSLYGNNKVFLLPTADRYLLAVLNSPLLWWHNWRYLPHMKDEALNPAGFRLETLPIAEPTPEIRTEAEDRVTALIALAQESQDQTRELLNWLRLEFGVDQPGQRLEAFADLTADDFVAEIRKRRPKAAPASPPRPSPN